MLDLIDDSQYLTEEEFDKRFTLTEFADGDQTTDNINVIRQYPTNRVWSLVDDGEDGMCLVSGFATVNFVSWQVTEEPHNAEYCEITVQLDMPEHEEE